MNTLLHLESPHVREGLAFLRHKYAVRRTVSFTVPEAMVPRGSYECRSGNAVQMLVLGYGYTEKQALDMAYATLARLRVAPAPVPGNGKALRPPEPLSQAEPAAAVNHLTEGLP